MRRMLRRLGARTGISVGLVLVIAAVLVVARLIDDRRDPALFPRPPGTTPTVAATEGDDGPVDETPDPLAGDEAVVTSATAFATAWLDRTRPAEQWLAGLRPHATDDLIERLTGVDPLSVPSDVVLGTPTIRGRSAAYAEVLIPIGPGNTLVLGVVDLDGRWVVATLDQETSLSLGAALPRDPRRALVALRLARDSLSLGAALPRDPRRALDALRLARDSS